MIMKIIKILSLDVKVSKSFSDGIRKYQHTTAATYNMQVQQEKIEADLRGFESVIDFYYIVKK